MSDVALIPTGWDIGSFLPRSNPCPSTEAYTNVELLTENYEPRLAAILDNIERLKARLTIAEHRQAHTQGTLVKFHAPFAPIKRLPPEILSEIFEHCLEVKNPGALFSATARRKEAPLLLGRVCRSWRTIAHTTPRLWQDIFINICDGRYSSALRKDASPVLQTWIAHSGGLPLHLVILCKTERVLPGLVDLFATIAAHAARWKTVHVSLQNSPVIHRLVCHAFKNCTSLSTLDATDGGQCMSPFGSRQPDGLDEVQPINFDFPLAPLQQLSLSLAGLTIQDVHASWTTLTRLSFMQDARSSASSIADYVAILRQCTSLKECSITIDSGVEDAPLEPFTLPRLECLQLLVLQEAGRTTQLGDFLGALHAPRLCALSIQDYCLPQDTVLYYSQLKTFLQGNGQSLRGLRFSTGSKMFTPEDMIGLIAETPLLTELECRPDEASSPRALLEALTPRVQGDVLECLLPCLERFFVCWDTAETVSMVGDMIEKRYALVERGIVRMKRLSWKPVRMGMLYDCVPPYMLVEHLAARLELCRCTLEVHWKAHRGGGDSWFA